MGRRAQTEEGSIIQQLNQKEKLKLEEVYNYIYQFKSEKAIEILEKIIKDKNSSPELKQITLYKKADILFQEKHYSEAKRVFERFLEEYPNSKFVQLAKERIKFVIS